MSGERDSEILGTGNLGHDELARTLAELTQSRADLKQSRDDLAKSQSDLEESRASLAQSQSLQASSESRLAMSRQALMESDNLHEQRDLLSRELSHRLKNSLAVAQAIAVQTFRGDPRIEAFNGRLAALGAAQDLLLQSAWSAVTLEKLVKRTLAVVAPLDRIDIAGDDYRLDPRRALSLALALHELGTNALKYGALSNEGGRVSIRWKIADGRLKFRWVETGGPAVAPPLQKGFGHRLITRNLESDFDGDVALNHYADGVVLDLSAPV